MVTAELPQLSSEVRAVTVYRRGALVVRRAELRREGPSFPPRVQLVGLPLTIEDASVRVEVSSAEGSAPLASSLQVTVGVPAEDPKLPPPTDDDLEAAKLELALANEELNLLNKANERLGLLTLGPRGAPALGETPKPSPTAARLELLAFRRELSERLAEELPAVQERVRQAKERLDTLRERERMTSPQRNLRPHEIRKTAVLGLDLPPGAGALAELIHVELSYFVPGARWAPAYAIRLDRSMRSASLELRAMVGQATGEDWRDVALTLSTATPQQWTELPELKAVKIGRRQPPPAKTGWRSPPVGAAELYSDYDRDLGRETEARGGGRLSAKLATAVPQSVTRSPSARERLETLADSAEFDLDEDLLEMRRAAMTSGAPPSRGQAMPGFPVPQQQSSKRRARRDVPPAPSKPPAAAMPSGAPMPAMPKSAKSSLFGSAGIQAQDAGGGAGHLGLSYEDDDAALEPATAPALVVGRELLDYGRLRLPPADEPKRGSLQRVQTRALYEQAGASGVELGAAFDLIDAAVRRARGLDGSTPPSRHHWPTSEAGFDYAFAANDPIDLDNDVSFRTLTIDARGAACEAHYIAIPRETQDVFRVVGLQNPLAAPLLPGPVDVYIDGRFTLTTDLELVPADGRIELGLGVEQAIKIARNVRFNEDSSGMFKRSLQLRHELEVEVANHLPEAATIEVRERLPHVPESTTDVELVLESVSPSWRDYDQDDPPLTSGRHWTVEVPAGAQRKLSAAWTITLPKDHELVGGNRREH
ncbi:mucoidy inhibitor MuiA family protein [Pseudenhygromyxa sp. WMMC2535]|uniref:mucoidy inhibitor MuiA family protein n=1 Tax=Pseudenhygromyxa sp. WMMC2535 TaxID=2712867 RepID=UPI0015957906|nr:mucoidy inhibitor MuiA family protein [Pseudenhygromyxa sp. WMMC2535]NVB37462.1 mucoidy inhibitor MuiA family protein [Pseudenhygromyxa sp. WMMC2535]